MTTSFGSTQLTEEFSYGYGDPRTHFLEYLLSMPNYTLATISGKGKNTPNYFQFTCNADNKRIFVPPKNIKKVTQKLSSGASDEPLIIFPVMCINKLLCKQKNRSKHLMLILYNSYTGEVERIDLRKYHMDGFSLKKLVTLLKQDFIPKYIVGEAELNHELDVPEQFVNKHDFKSDADAFPLFLMAYLHTLSEDPAQDRDTVMRHVKKLSSKAIKEIWKNYTVYRMKTGVPPCNGDETKRYNPETNKCLKIKSMEPLLLVEPAPTCKKNLVPHPLTNKCVTTESIKEVDILDKLLISKGKDTATINLSNPEIIFKATNYIVGLHPNVRYVHSPNAKTKQDSSITWQYDGERFNLVYPDNMWQVWDKYMADPSVKFLIILISSASFYKDKKENQGRHANVLIYDKDTNEMERFDSLGYSASSLYRMEELDALLIPAFNQHTPKPIKYFTPMDFCPKIPIFQVLELNDIPAEDDIGGNCAVWRLWYIHVKLSNPHLNRKELVELANAKLKKSKSRAYNFIKAYQRFILKNM